MNDQAADRRAQAIAEVTKMQDDLGVCHKEIATLRRDLDRETDRCAMMVEERDRYRIESGVYKTKLIELARSMANIGLLTRQAEEVMMTVNELAEAETPEQAAAAVDDARRMAARLAPVSAAGTTGQ
jgi:uncharacterized coiled-coil DUF342 family protein